MFQYLELECGCLQAVNAGDRRPMLFIVKYCDHHESQRLGMQQRMTVAERAAVGAYLLMVIGMVIVVVYVSLPDS